MSLNNVHPFSYGKHYMYLTGSSSQPPTDDMEELVFQIIRDMTQVFCIVLSMWMMRYIFGITKGNTTPHWSKTTRCLSTKGATEIVKEARSCNAKELQASDDMEIALITGISLCIRLSI
eukprot:1109676_1